MSRRNRPVATMGSSSQNTMSDEAGTSKVVALTAHAPLTRDEELTYAMAAARRTERRRIVSFVRLCDFIIASAMRAMLNYAAQLALNLASGHGVLPCHHHFRCHKLEYVQLQWMGIVHACIILDSAYVSSFLIL
jgi:hypothetical protein